MVHKVITIAEPQVTAGAVETIATWITSPSVLAVPAVAVANIAAAVFAGVLAIILTLTAQAGRPGIAGLSVGHFVTGSVRLASGDGAVVATPRAAAVAVILAPVRWAGARGASANISVATSVAGAVFIGLVGSTRNELSCTVLAVARAVPVVPHDVHVISAGSPVEACVIVIIVVSAYFTTRLELIRVGGSVAAGAARTGICLT